MKVLLLNGSPHANGCTAAALTLPSSANAMAGMNVIIIASTSNSENNLFLFFMLVPPCL